MAVVLVAIVAASPKLVDLGEVAVVVDVDVVAHAAFAGVEAVRQAGSLDLDVVIAEIAQ